ncbi:MAG: hypothetical protein Q4G42_03885 [Neisseria sp.]|nr:hypothetical protein [Neisseria sp.]
MYSPYRINYLFDSQGKWIAFRKGKHVFAADSQWIGWTPWRDNEVFSPSGVYIGTITHGNRLYRYRQRIERGFPGNAERPYFPGIFPQPEYPGRAVLPPWAEDLDFTWSETIDLF